MNIKNIFTSIAIVIALASCSHSQDKPLGTLSSLSSKKIDVSSQEPQPLSETILGNGSSLQSLVSTCATCHSGNGLATNINTEWPNLAGQNVDYLVLQLSAFRDGHRVNALMSPAMLKNLSDQDLNLISRYYSQRPPAQISDPSTIDLRELPGAHVRARCISCHGMSGNSVTSLWPNIAGQNTGYLAKQLRDYKSGARKHPIMQVIGSELSEQQIIDVSDYYSLAK